MSTKAPEVTQTARDRFHGLDAARAIALLLGIFLHSSMSFWPFQVGWAIQDRSTGMVSYILGFHYIHMFRLAAFFLMAGFFGHLVYHRRGAGAFVRDRLKRILVPLVCGWMVVFPVIVLVWIWGGRVAGAPQAPGTGDLPLWKVWVGAFSTGALFSDGVQPAHLWFLYCLLQLYALTLAARPLLGWLRAGADAFVRVAFGRLFGPAILVLPIGAAIYMMRSPSGVVTPDKNLWPAPLVLLAYGSMFAGGWLLHRQTALLDALARRSVPYVLLGLAAGAVPLALTLHLVPTGWAGPNLEAPASAACYALGMVFLSLGFTGACLRWLARPRPAIRYLSDASYWLYIVHLPLVCALQVAVARWALHWSLKWALILAISVPLLLLSYQYLVRYTFIGWTLNGPRQRGPHASGATVTGR